MTAPSSPPFLELTAAISPGAVEARPDENYHEAETLGESVDRLLTPMFKGRRQQAKLLGIKIPQLCNIINESWGGACKSTTKKFWDTCPKGSKLSRRRILQSSPVWWPVEGPVFMKRFKYLPKDKREAIARANRKDKESGTLGAAFIALIDLLFETRAEAIAYLHASARNISRIASNKPGAISKKYWLKEEALPGVTRFQLLTRRIEACEDSEKKITAACAFIDFGNHLSQIPDYGRGDATSLSEKIRNDFSHFWRRAAGEVFGDIIALGTSDPKEVPREIEALKAQRQLGSVARHIDAILDGSHTIVADYRTLGQFLCRVHKLHDIYPEALMNCEELEVEEAVQTALKAPGAAPRRDMRTATRHLGELIPEARRLVA